VLDKAKTLTLPVINRTPDVTPAAQACCGVCRSCATTNAMGLAGGLVVAGSAYVARAGRRLFG
jgi:hypothetical protein